MKWGRIILLGVATVAAALGGCTDADMSTLDSLGHKFDVICYSGDRVILQDVSTGQVQPDVHGSGHYYRSAKTGGLVNILASCVATEQRP